MLNSVIRSLCLLSICITTTLAGCGPQFPPQAEWTRTATPDGLSSAIFPAAPRNITQTVPSAIGNLNITMTMYDKGSYAFMISNLKYPVDPAMYDVPTGLEAAAQGAAQNVSGTLEENSDIEFQGIPGKSILVKTPQGVYVRGRVYIDPAGPTLYQIQCVGPKQFIDGNQTTAFLDSLEIKTGSPQ